MKNVLKKKLGKKGFTLAELLIVIAIIGVLVAIMFPVFGSAITKAEFARDVANVRAAYSEAVVDAMTSSTYTGGELTVAKTKIDAAAAKGKCTLDYTSGIKVTSTTDDSLTETIPVDEDVKFGT